jgi:hypothetical protein
MKEYQPSTLYFLIKSNLPGVGVQGLTRTKFCMAGVESTKEVNGRWGCAGRQGVGILRSLGSH